MALGLPEVVEDEPFGPDVLVYKVAGKIFAVVHEGGGKRPGQVTLRCGPALALHLREEHPAVVPESSGTGCGGSEPRRPRERARRRAGSVRGRSACGVELCRVVADGHPPLRLGE